MVLCGGMAWSGVVRYGLASLYGMVRSGEMWFGVVVHDQVW